VFALTESLVGLGEVDEYNRMFNILKPCVNREIMKIQPIDHDIAFEVNWNHPNTTPALQDSRVQEIIDWLAEKFLVYEELLPSGGFGINGIRRTNMQIVSLLHENNIRQPS
jgi:hypothetical protein